MENDANLMIIYSFFATPDGVIYSYDIPPPPPKFWWWGKIIKLSNGVFWAPKLGTPYKKINKQRNMFYPECKFDFCSSYLFV